MTEADGESVNHINSKNQRNFSNGTSAIKSTQLGHSKYVEYKTEEPNSGVVARYTVIRYIENKPSDEYSVTKEDYDEYMRYKNSKWMSRIKKENRINRVNGGPRAKVKILNSEISFLWLTQAHQSMWLISSHMINLYTYLTFKDAIREIMDIHQNLLKY